MNTRKPGVDDSQNERYDIASLNQFEPVSDGAHRDIDPVIPRIEPIVPRVETIEVNGVEVRPTPEMRPGATTIRKPHPPERLKYHSRLTSRGTVHHSAFVVFTASGSTP